MERQKALPGTEQPFAVGAQMYGSALCDTNCHKTFGAVKCAVETCFKLSVCHCLLKPSIEPASPLPSKNKSPVYSSIFSHQVISLCNIISDIIVELMKSKFLLHPKKKKKREINSKEESRF